MKEIESPEVGISAKTDGLDFVQKHTVSAFVLFVTVTRVNVSYPLNTPLLVPLKFNRLDH